MVSSTCLLPGNQRLGTHSVTLHKYLSWHMDQALHIYMGLGNAKLQASALSALRTGVEPTFPTHEELFSIDRWPSSQTLSSRRRSSTKALLAVRTAQRAQLGGRLRLNDRAGPQPAGGKTRGALV